MALVPTSVHPMEDTASPTTPKAATSFFTCSLLAAGSAPGGASRG